MKKQVLLGLALMLCCFITGGIYIVKSIQDVTEKLEQVISFHEVEYLRKTLGHHIKAVQSDLLLQGSPHFVGTKASISLIEAMERSADICLSCHHSDETSKRLGDLEEAIEYYMKLLSRTMTIRANNERLENARMTAFAQGEKLLDTVKALSVASADKISARVKKINGDINATKRFLIACLVLGPLVIFIITVLFLKRFTGSIRTLVQATKQLEDGDLDYRIETPLKDEFKTLARSFNGMAEALKVEQNKFESIHKLYQTLFESAGDAIVITGLDTDSFGKIVSANKATCDLYGYTLGEMIGMDINKLVPDNKKHKFNDHIRTVFDKEWTHHRMQARKKDGTLLHVDLSMGLLQVSEHNHLLIFCRDISDLLRAEEEQQRVNQMVVVGQMAAGIAHEIKNPLAGVKVSLDVLAEELQLQQEDKELFARIINEVNRMERLLKSLLNYARPPLPHFDLVDMNRLIENCLNNVKVVANTREDTGIHFKTDFAVDLPQTEADSSQIQQVLLNIYLNACDAIETEGTITTITRLFDQDSIWIEICDTGKGMSKQSLVKIFNPFFTTKTKGTGLGLSISKRLIEQHGGQMEVHSNEGIGTSFIIKLPLKHELEE